ncbi:MAG TPA: sodium/proton-translocating pyrophosphatase, partial [Chloroflexota bacterium]
MGLVWVVPVVGFLAILFAVWLARDVLSRDAGTPAMQQVASMIFEGAIAFLYRQYRTISMLAVVTAVVIGVLVGAFAHNSVEGVLTGV